MDMIPRNDYGERCQFDAYCKLVLYHEAIDYLREMQRRRDRELSFSDLPQMEMDKLCTRTLYDPDGQPHVRVDEYMKRRLEIKLIHSIVSMS